MNLIRLSVMLAAVLIAGPLGADLSAVLAERNLEKRSRKALENAAAALKAADKSYWQGNLKQTLAALEEVRESVDLSYESLKQTGKDPSRSPKHFKRAEIKTRELLRKMRDFRERMAVDDRPHIDKVRARVQEVHDDLLLGIMGRKR